VEKVATLLVPAEEAEEAAHMPLEAEDRVLVNTAEEDTENSAAVVLEAEDDGKDNLRPGVHHCDTEEKVDGKSWS
jgi:hypothetical protein